MSKTMPTEAKLNRVSNMRKFLQSVAAAEIVPNAALVPG